MRKRVGLIVTLLIVVGGLATGSLRTPTASAQQPGDVALRELAERLLAAPYIGGPGAPSRVQLLPGQLPSDLPVALSLPPGARVVGSSVRLDDAPLPGNVVSAPRATIVLDVSGAPNEAIAFYERALAEQGWGPAQGGPFGRMGGFQGLGPGPGLVYCQTPDGPSLTISAYQSAATMADVRLALAMGAGLCSMPTPPVGPAMPAGADRIPRLYPPDGVLLQTNFGTGGSQNRWTSEAVATTDKPTAELEAFFAQQLAAAGWTRLAGQAAGALSWSTWQVPGDGDWQGVLLVIDGPGPDKRSLSVRVESATAMPGSGVSSFYTVGGGISSSSYMVPGPVAPAAPVGPVAPPGPGFAAGLTPTPTPTAIRP